MSNDTAIRIEGLWKRYGFPTFANLRDSWESKRNGKHAQTEMTETKRKQWALQDINLEVKRGEALGILGRNGAGKSTLLKVLAGVTPPTRGGIEVHGKLFPMIELNAGLHMELTGRENVRLLGTIMGLSRRQIEAKMPEIEAFCELEEKFDEPVRRYSSGMLVRLGFSVAVNVDSDILLIDEVLAVGDLTFQRKCYNHIERLRKQDKTVLFVSHSIRQIERICDRGLLLDKGQPIALDDTATVLHQYTERSYENMLAQNIVGVGDMTRIRGTGEVSLKEVLVLDDDHNVTQEIDIFENITIQLAFDVTRPLNDPFVAIQIFSIDMICVASINNLNAGSLCLDPGHSTIDCYLSDLRLMPGVYSLHLKVRDGNGAIVLMGDHIGQFRVVGKTAEIGHANGGLVHVRGDWHFSDTVAK